MMNIRRSARVAARIVAAAGTLAIVGCSAGCPTGCVHPPIHASQGYDVNDALIAIGANLMNQAQPAWRPPVICNTMRTGYGNALTTCD
jgi:predicted kinase